MATTPRAANTRRKTSSRTKKPVTVDLDADQVKEVAPASADTKTGEAVRSKDATAQARKNKAAASSSRSSNAASAGTATAKSTTTSTLAKDQASTSSAGGDVKKADTKGENIVSSSPSHSSASKSSSSKSSASGNKTSGSKGEPKSTTGKQPQASPEAVIAAATTNPANSGTGFGKLAAAGIIGGLISLIGAGALQYSGMLPNMAGNTIVKENITQPAVAVDIGPLEAKLAELQSQMQKLGEVKAPEVDLTPIVSRIANLENAAPVQATDASLVEKFANQLKSIEGEVETLQTNSGQMRARLDDVGPTGLDQAATDGLIKAALAPLAEQITPLKQQSRQTASKLVELESKFASLTTKIDEEVDERINRFDEKLKNAATGERLAKSVAINALKSAVDNGEPFSAALSSIETLSGPSETLDKLKPVASGGVASTKTLLNEFHDLQNSILMAATSDPDAGLTDRLMSSIQSLVTVTSSEALPGDSPKAVISRIEANLKSDNLALAMDEWKSLPQPARDISNSWAEKLGKRIAAQQQLKALIEALQPKDIKS